ncbi:Xaa-Pro peptidase family protein [Azotosporobacter soli]|uniref:M24 family metallopeptidase n=1 Tax=Azotosporobacter soli TaxID=3055040 RepID=UPI0031FEC914
MLNQERIQKTTANMAEMGIDQLIITDPTTIFYLSGAWLHTGKRMLAMLVGRDTTCRLFVHEMFQQSDALGMPVTYFSDIESPVAVLNAALAKTGVVGIDSNWPARFLLELQELNTTVKMVRGSFAVDGVRMCKDETEQAKMQEASRLNDLAMAKIQKEIQPGRTELEMVEILSGIYRELGTAGFSFDPIISYGAGAAEPHHTSDDTCVKPGDCIVIDIGCKKNEYCSDMTRTVFYKTVSPEAEKVYNLVKEANLSAIAAVKPGVRFCDIDRAARSVIEAGGYGPFFTHRTGHCIGLDVHDFGDVSAANELPVREGMIFSIEPGIYLKGKFGVRIEDLVLVTKDGCKVLNAHTKELTIID